MAVLWTCCEPSLGRHVHRELLRSVWLDLTPIIATTACHQRNYIERYSRFNWQREKNGQGENQFLRLTAPSWVLQGGFSMHRQHTQKPQGVRRRELLRAGLA